MKFKTTPWEPKPEPRKKIAGDLMPGLIRVMHDKYLPDPETVWSRYHALGLPGDKKWVLNAIDELIYDRHDFVWLHTTQGVAGSAFTRLAYIRPHLNEKHQAVYALAMVASRFGLDARISTISLLGKSVYYSSIHRIVNALQGTGLVEINPPGNEVTPLTTTPAMPEFDVNEETLIERGILKRNAQGKLIVQGCWRRR